MRGIPATPTLYLPWFSQGKVAVVLICRVAWSRNIFRCFQYFISNISIFYSLVQRLCLNGSSGQEVVVKKDLQNVEALTFDPISRLLYWVDAGAQKIEVQRNLLVL